MWCCMTWAVRVGYKAIEVASGADKTPGIVAAEATGVRRKWGGGEIRSRVTRQGNSWVVDGQSPYASQYNSPASSSFPTPNAQSATKSPYTNGSAASYGLGIAPDTPGSRQSYTSQRQGSALSAAGVPLPSTPDVHASSSSSPFPPSPMPSSTFSVSPYSQYVPNSASANGSFAVPSGSNPAGPPRHVRTESKKDD